MAATINTANGPYIVIPQNILPTVVPTALQTAQGQQAGLYQKFLKGQPKALGTIQIMLTLPYISLGTVLIFTIENYLSISTYSGISFWGPVFYIMSGSLSIAAGHKLSSCKVQGALALNIISSLVSLGASGLYCTDLVIEYFNYRPPCTNQCGMYHDVFIIRLLALGFLLFSSLLEFCVSVSLSAFGCRSLNNPPTPPQVIVISNDYRIPVGTPLHVGNANQNLPGGGMYSMPERPMTVP